MARSAIEMAHGATSTSKRPILRVRARLSVLVGQAWASVALRDAWRSLWWSRLAIAVVAIFAAATVAGSGVPEANSQRFDDPLLTQPLGGLGDALLSPLAHWDSVWYLRVADTGYPSADPARTAFFPLYPLLVRGVGRIAGGSNAALLLAAFAISLLALLAALVLLHKLVELELGRRFALPTLVLVCAFPASLFFGAPYSESLFLLCSVGAIYAARSGHWAWAGVAAGLASGTRSAGILLLAPLLLLYLYGPREDRPETAEERDGWRRLVPRYKPRPDFAWLALAPLGLALYTLYLGIAHGEPLQFANVQDLWNREFGGPLGGIRDGAVAAWDGVRQLASGSRTPVVFEQSGGDPFRVAGMNLMLFATLLFAFVGLVGVLRRLPLAYGVYVALGLVLATSYPVGPQPLMSLPRFVAVLFPIFMWLALACERRGRTLVVSGAFAVGLGLFVSQYASWWFVA